MFRPPVFGCASVRAAPLALILLALCSGFARGQETDGATYGFISFSTDRVEVQEDSGSTVIPVQLPMIREVGTTGDVLAIVQVTNDSVTSDFFSSSAAVSFEIGQTTAEATLFLRNDENPEGNETFIVEITGTRFGADIGSVRRLVLFVRANDEPYGEFHFNEGSLSTTVSESSTGNSVVELTVERSPGTFGRVTVNYQVISGPNNGIDDLSPTQGQLVFNDRVGNQTITITVTADEIPEDEEMFTISLSNPRGGAILASNDTQAVITVRENDTPIRFSQMQYTVEEDAGSVELTVTRGVLADGTEIGNLAVDTTVEYATSSGMATAGVDYETQSGTITFASGVTTQTISIPITDDSDPEGDELFSVSLLNPSSDAVLSTPSSAMVLIEVSDNAGGLVQFASAGPVVVGEDDGSVAELTVQRLNGTYSDVTVEWQIVDSTGNLASDDFETTRGNLTILDGENSAVLQIRPLDDATPEIAEQFIVELVGVVSRAGELHSMGTRVASLIVEDSDDVYGLVELAADTELWTTNGNPRQLHLEVTRNQGTTGTISVDYLLAYLPEGVSDPAEGDASVFASASGSVRLVGGQMVAEWDVEILNDAFLDSNARFYAKLNSTYLVEGVVPLVTPTNSPRIGPRSEAYVSISAAVANGFISFAPASLSVSVDEAGDFASTVSLTLSRSGAYGTASVSWTVTSITTDDNDLGTTGAVATIQNGSTSVEILVVIINDDEPEVDESFEVQLVSVAESSSQMIDSEQDTATVTIRLNDNAEGVFSLSSAQSQYAIQESSLDVISITIQREEGALTTQAIQYQTVPGSGEDFIGGVGIVTFSPGQTEQIVSILPNDDSIPENSEEFNFTISAGVGNNRLLGSPTSLEITILSNDDYAGVFRFTDASLDISIDEPGLEGVSSTATFTVQRDAGTFTEVMVDWQVTALNASSDVNPTTGSVTFSEGQTTGIFTITALEDEIPEDDLRYTVALTEVSGDGRLASSSTQARLTVQHNDDPVNLRVTESMLNIREGDTVDLVVARGGHMNGEAEVSFQVTYTSASADDVTIIPTSGLVTLVDGQNETTITLAVHDDAIPEETESLVVELTSTTGDAVLVEPTRATINILPSDDPNGVFQFAASSRDLTGEEGDTLQITVERLQGSFGTVDLQVASYLLNASTDEQTSTSTATDLSPATILLTFTPGETSKTFDLAVLDEETPEFEERFELELTIESIEGDSEDGARLGTFASTLVVVPENDDPHGLFAVTTATMNVEVAEDVEEGEEGGSVEVQVERRFGDSGYVQVAWEVVPELDPPLPSFTDLLFLGSRGSAVSDFQPRNDTETLALAFSGQANSLVTVPSQYHPPTVSNQLTLSLWLQMAAGSSGGVLVAKTADSGSTVFYGLEVTANGGDFLIRFSYLPASRTSGSESVEVSVVQSSLADSSWHSLTVTVSGNTANFYQDGSLINSRTLEESSIRDGSGELTVGGIGGVSDSFFTGALQDVRVYADSLDLNQVSAISTDEAASSLTPISGYLSYSDGTIITGVTLTTKDDLVPEPSAVFTLQLTTSDGGSRIEPTASSASVTVLKSDAANGVFGFDSSSLSNTIAESGSVSLTVQRLQGDYGSVTLHWEIREAATAFLASSDFNPASGSLEFSEGDRQEVLAVQPSDETVPELDEEFTVLLVEAVSNDGYSSSTPTSGASIDPSLERSNLTVTENDYPYGLLQFSTSPPPAAGIIPATTTTPELEVRESDGTFTVYIVRAQGNLGTISAEYLTTDGTATSVGANPDYNSEAGTAEFGPDDRQVSVELSLVDDATPELGKVFYVNLTNPTGDQGVPGLSIGSTLIIRILPSDDAFGVFSFAADSLSRVVAEEEGGTGVSLTVQRQGGTFEDVTVYWEVEGGGNGDISPTSGQVDFTEGQTQGQLTVTINNDQVPELEEVFSIRLLNASSGATITTTASQVATVTIQANDHPYGLFTFSSAFRPLTVSEDVGEVEVMVTREFGDTGSVTVGYSTVESGDSSLDGLIDLTQLGQNSQLAAAGVDYTLTSGSLVFAGEEVTKSFILRITDDTVSEVAEYAFVAITSVQLDFSSVDSVDNSVLPTAASGNGSVAFIVISENDDARGILQLSSSTYDAEEPSQNFVTVNRGAGTFGTVSVGWEAVAVTAQSADFSPQSGTVQIAAGASSAQLPLSIINDSDPEFSETLSVSLLAAGGGARLGGILMATVTILANDDPNGALEFAEASRAVQVSEPENSATASISLTVERTGGATGVVEVSWSITADNGADPSVDIVPVSGTLQFISNVRQQQIILSVIADDIPEITESFTVSLTSVTGGARIGDSPSATVEILGNDNPYGFVSFGSLTFVTIEEDSDSVAVVPVVRSAGTFGNISVLYSTTSQQSAEAGSDYTSVTGEIITIPEGSSLANIPITILADELPELNETFELALINVFLSMDDVEESGQGGPQLGSITATDIIILENDDPYGRFHITGSGGESTVRVPEVGSLGVVLVVERQAGRVGTVQVTWSVTGGTATQGADFGGSGAVLTFDEDSTSNTISLIIFEDIMPERDEDIIVSLSDPTGGAVLAGNGGSMSTVVIEANDNAAGIVGLADTARSAIVDEGQTVSLGLERSIGNLGVVEVDWEISGIGDVSQEFVATSGTATFQDGSSTAEVVFQVAADGTPELAEVYSLSLTAVRTVSDDISEMGIAEFDSLATMATLTVRASDNPHGVVEFQTVQAQSEESSPVTLTVVREFGMIGTLDVVYEAVMGSLGPLEANTSLATPGVDFDTTVMSFRLEDGQQSAIISVIILDDNDPELSEVFLVSLSSVTLLDSDGDVPPSIGTNNQAQVTILPNDNPEGILTFREDSVNVMENVGDFVLTVHRDQGLVGRVSVVALITGRGATIDQDYVISTHLMEVVFVSGDSQEDVVVSIVDDAVPELDEMFCVSLILPESGAVIGDIPEVCVTILLNDDAHGQFSFDSSSVSVTIEESGEISTSANVAELRVIRSGGVIGDVTIPYEVEQAGRNDLAPISGTLLFAENQNFRILQITAVRDDIPELDETYTVTLLDPDIFGDLSNVNATASITILANQNPYGFLEIFPIDSDSSSLTIEEDNRYVELEIRRSFGTFGSIMVTLNTVEGSAISPSGDSFSFTTTQFLDTTSAEKWYHFTREDGRQYLFLASSSLTGNSALFEWRGAFVSVQTLSTVGATAATFLSVDGRDLLVVSNAGSSGNREINSTVYEFTESGQLQWVQNIPSVGASDIVSLQTPNGEWYVVIASREDNEGNPNVDSAVLQWSGESFVPFQSLETIGASAVEVFSLEDSVYLAFASYTDSRSPVYVWREGQFRLDHHVDTQQATDVESVNVNGAAWLAIATGSSGVSLFRWSSDMGIFVFNTSLNSSSALRVENIPGTAFLLVTNSEEPGKLFELTEQQELYLPVSRHLYPFSLGIAVAISTQPGSVERSFIGQAQEISTLTDFYSRSTVLTFAPGQTSHAVVVEVIDDSTPELDEQFSVQLMEPVGGAVLGTQSSLTVTVLTNDNAYGLVGFAESSLSVVAMEAESSSVEVLQVVREGGLFGQVTASWQVMGDHSQGEITPTSGEVVFAEGVSEDTIIVTIHPDAVPELIEVTTIALTAITENGVPPGGDTTRGAQLLPGRTQSVITVQANDAPHGVVVWSASTVPAIEEDAGNSVVQLTILREFGSIGAILITYSTFTDNSVPLDDQATTGDDYLPTSSNVVMGDGVTSINVSITIFDDNEPEIQESFLVSLTNVTLVEEGDRQGSTSDSPRIDPDQDTVTVQISENDNSRGLLEFVVAEATVNEDVGSISLEVVRSGGTFGTVGTDFNLMGVTATGGGEDYSPDSDSLQFGMDVSSQNITIDIINDSEAELDESFVVSLVNPQDGVVIGDMSSVTVTINRNDDINGVFIFDMDSVLILLPESEGPDDTNGVATLTVLRTRNTVGEVTVYWEVSEEGRMDLEPTSGNLTFGETETEKTFQVRAVDDGIPELFEAFLVNLVSIEGGGRIGDPSEARIAIQASDDPSGVVGFDSYPGGIIINEGDLLIFRILRSAGLNGEVTATWRIIPSDTAVFTTTSTIVSFADGQSEAVVSVQTIPNDIPETARLFSLEIVSTGLALVDTNSSQVDIIVTASDDPHGVVEFGEPSAVTTDESDTMISIPIERRSGRVGDLRVNFSILSSSTATNSEDYTLHNQTIVIPANTASAELLVTIIDDTLPELSEDFSLSLESVEFTQDINGGRDFDFAGDPATIDQYPRLGSVTEFTLTIFENDDPFGVISFTSPSLIVTEGDTAVLNLERTGGTFGLVILTVTVNSGGADSSDYTDITDIPVQFFPGQTSEDISISITQDDQPELQEEFTVSIALFSSSSPAVLGLITSVTVIIDSSDSPHGELGFREPLMLSPGNPTFADAPVTLDLTVERMNGSIGQTQVEWDIVGPYPGQEMTDISPTGDTLELQNGQSTGMFTLTILPSEGDEEEKTFTVTLRSASNDAVINTAAQTVTITIAQRGMPYGTIGLFGDVLQLHKVNEGVGDQTALFPIARSAPALGNVMVPFIVTGDTDPSLDVYPTSGTILFASGLSQVDFLLNILDDTDPELEETFTLILSQPTGGAILDPQAMRSTFTIRANDAPYGRFAIDNPSIAVDQTVFSEVSRNFLYTILRDNGLIGDILLNVVTTYNPDPTAEYVEEFSTVIVDGRREEQVTLPIASSTYLAPGSIFTISISEVSLQNLEAQEGSGPEVSGPTELTVTDNVANALIGFDVNSLAATVNDEGNNVALTVVRSGALGTVMVYWITGLPDSTIANGSITPDQGSFQMNPTDTSAQIILTVTPRDPHGAQEVFAVILSVEPLVPLTLPAEVDPATRMALLEPSGVVQLASDAFSGVESSGNILVTVQRYYGSMGDIQVFGMATVAPNSSIPANQEAAVQGTDFTGTLVQVTIPDGSTSGVLSVPVTDNLEFGPLKVFQFTLTSVVGGSSTSPRLSTTGSLSAVLTIIDDEAGAGLFRLLPTSDTVQEERERVSFSILREGGSQGRVTVTVETVEGNSEATGGEMATDGVDYIGLALQEVVFEDGDLATKTFVISVADDAEPELDEQFTVVLSNPPGGSALIDPTADTLVVTIAASDSPGGIFSLSTSAITLSEESAPTGTIAVQRAGGTLTEVTIEWQAFYTDGQGQNTTINRILGVSGATLTFPVGDTSANINLALQPDSVPASGVVFTLRIDSDDAGIDFGSITEATVTVEAKQSSLFQIAAADIKKVVTTSGSFTVGVERVNGTQLTASVKYSTVELSDSITIGQLTIQPAQFGVHFTEMADTLTFDTSVTKMDIVLNIIDSAVTRPVAFNITIFTSESELHGVRNSQATVVINPPGPLSRLISIYFDTLEATTIPRLESVTNSLYRLLTDGVLVGSTTESVNGEEQTQTDITQYIISEVITRASARYTSYLTGNVSDIFQRIIDDITFSRRSQFVQTMQTFAYSLLDGQPCDDIAPVRVSFSRLLYHLEAVRLPPSYLDQRRFTADFNSDDDYVKFPRSSIFPGSSLTGLDCLDIHYIELVEERLLLEPTLSSKVLSIGIRSQSAQTQSPITYRIYTNDKVMPTDKDCLLWNRTSKSWDNNVCRAIRSGILPERNNFIECECFRLGEFAVTEDVETGYGWTLSAGLVMAFVIIVMTMVIAVHVRYFHRTQLATRVFLMLCVAILLFQLMMLVSVFASDQSDTTESGCTVIAIVLHFTVILQFVWILAVTMSLWMNFMGITDGKEPLIIYAIVCLVVAIIWMVSTVLIGRFALNSLEFSDVYGLVGDFCYTPELSVSLVSTLLPVVLAMLATIAFLSHSCVYWSRWEDFHNMYLDSFNKTEIPLLLVFFVLVFLSSVAAYVHLYVREVYTFGIFVTLDFFQGLYTLIVYVFFSCHTLTRKHRKYGIDDEVEPLTVPGEPDYMGSFTSLASSRQRLDIKQEEEHYEERKNRESEEDEEDSSVSEGGQQIIPLSLRRVPSVEPSLEGDDSQLDDLMFMLKTQNLPQDEDTQPLFPESPRKPSASEHLELRRISIADTHL